jgi:hypothetical protein
VNHIDTEDLVLLDAGPKGLGAFAARRFQRGETVLVFRGQELDPREIADFTHTIQVDLDRFLGASGGVDDYVNHSCDPSCILRMPVSELELVARRPIAPGEEITFDYSTCLLFEPPLDSCACGAPACRGRVVTFWDLAPAVRRRYRRLDAVPGFILRGRSGPVRE